MSEENKVDLNGPEVKKLIEEAVEKAAKEATDKAVSEMKSKLDTAYEARDKAKDELNASKKKLEEEAHRKLEEEGKFKELMEAKLATAQKSIDELNGKLKEAEGKLSDSENRITTLSRDDLVRRSLAGLEFRNEKAADLAFKEVIAELVKNDKGEWVHTSGKPVVDFVKEFSNDEDRAFLFKTKQNSGGGTPPAGGGDPSKTKPLSQRSQAEVIKMAEEGTLPNRQ